MSGLVKAAFFLGLAALLPAAALIAVAAPFGRAHAQDGPQLGVDASPQGNTATTLGQRNVCVAVATGDEFQIDVTVENVTALAAYEARLSLDTSIVHVVDRDVQQFLASPPGSNVFDFSESVPEDDNDDGVFRIGGAIITDPPLGADGSGVLARVTLKAAGPGVSTLTLKPLQTRVGVLGAVLTGVDGNQIGDSDGDSYFDGPFLDAQVAVDGACPGGEGVSRGAGAVLAGDDSGLAWWVFAAVAAGIVATAGFGGLALFRLRRSGRGLS
jgi:hypothetical protein